MIVVGCEVYIIYRDAVKINVEWLGRLIPSKRDEGSSTWQILTVVINICLAREAWKVLEDTCLKMVQMNISNDKSQLL